MSAEGGQKAIIAAIEPRVAPLLEAEGFELILLEFAPRGKILRFYIDHQNPDAGGVTLDDCTRVTHLIGDFLDGEGLSETIDGGFTLEVSSPGLDRPLVRPRHFIRFVGSEAQIVTHRDEAQEGGRRKFSGALLAADAEESGGIRLDIDGEARSFAYRSIERARLVPNFDGATGKTRHT